MLRQGGRNLQRAARARRSSSERAGPWRRLRCSSPWAAREEGAGDVADGRAGERSRAPLFQVTRQGLAVVKDNRRRTRGCGRASIACLARTRPEMRWFLAGSSTTADRRAIDSDLAELTSSVGGATATAPPRHGCAGSAAVSTAAARRPRRAPPASARNGRSCRISGATPLTACAAWPARRALAATIVLTVGVGLGATTAWSP